MADVEYRRLEPSELERVGEIDRRETIDAIYVQHGSRLELRHGDFSSPPWDRDGHGEHSVSALRAQLMAWSNAGAIALGAFAGELLVGMGMLLPRIRPGIAQLAFLYVSDNYRDRAIGRGLCDELLQIARDSGAHKVVVSATPSLNTVRFYERRGFRPTAEPLPELLAAEPDDVHMERAL